jgi:hypothetical protein
MEEVNMTDDIRLGEHIRYLEEKIRQRCGFIGIRLGKDLVKDLEKQLGQEFFWGVLVDKRGSQVLVVPEERVDARTFPSEKALWEHVGRTQIEEVEHISIVRLAGNPGGAVVCPSDFVGEGIPCIPNCSLLRQAPPGRK